jgi:PKD repeat protein
MQAHLSSLLIATALSAAMGTALAQPEHAAGSPPMFGKGHPFDIGDLPPGRTRDRLEKLPPPARERAMEWLQRFEFPAADLDSLEIDAEGGVLYVDPVPPAPAPGEEPGAGADGTAAEPAAASAVDDAFVLHSRPGAPNVVYLDFDGHVISGTAWNGADGPLYARPFDLDGSPSTFSEGERAAIAEIWHRVAEDLAPFDIDVTTEEPPAFDSNTGRVLITRSSDEYGTAMPYSTAGGVAYVGVYGSSNYAYYSPALVYYNNLAKATTYIAEASAHEFGHNLGLSHDGNGSTTYYAGHGSGYTSWAPIMGNSYYNNVTQWSNGEYSGANNTQDDVALIASKLRWAGDDHGDSLNNATPLVVGSDGQVFASNPELDPHNLNPANKGVIDDAADQDLFVFSIPAGLVDLSVTPAWDAFYRTSKRGANLDIQARLMNAQGQVLASSDPTSDTDAAVTASVPTGVYYLAVTGVGNGNYSDYASAGQYHVVGSVPAGTVPNLAPTAEFSFACTDLDCSFFDGSSDVDGNITQRAWDFGDGGTSTLANPVHTYAAAGSYDVTLTVTDDDNASASRTQGLSVTEPFVDTEDPVISGFSPASGEVSGSVTLSAEATDNVGVVRLDVSVRPVDVGADYELLCSGTSPISCNWNLRKVATGGYDVQFKALDAAGNEGTATTMVTVTEGTTKGGGKGNSKDDGGDSGTTTKGNGRKK